MPTLSDAEFADFGAAPKVLSDADFQSFGAPAKAPTSFGGALADAPQSGLDAGVGAVKAGASNISQAFKRREADPNEGFWGGALADIKDHLVKSGKFWGGVGEIAGSPIAAGYGAVSAPVGYGLASAERAIGEPIAKHLNPNATMPNWDEQYDQAKADAAEALQVAQPKSGLRPPAPSAPVPAISPKAAANAKAAGEFGINLSRGQAAESLDDIRTEDLMSRGAYGKAAQEQVAAPFFEQQFKDIQAGGENVGQTLARTRPIARDPETAATTINTELSDAGARSRQGLASLDATSEAETSAARGMHADQGRVLNETIQQGHMPIENPREAGEIVGHEVRTQATADRQAYQDRYNEATRLPGEFHADAFEGIGNRMQSALSQRDNPVIIDDVTTPVASRAIRDLDNISNLRIQNRADPHGQPNPQDIAAIDLRGVDQARKRLVAFYKGARSSGNAADARAAGSLIDEFDNQVEGAISNGLFTGDPRALDAIREARAAYSNYARTYRPQQAGDDVGTAMRRIIDRQATPEEISNMVTGSGRLGNAGLPVRLADRLERVLGQNSDGWNAIRQAIWQRASQVRNSAGEVDPVRSAASIEDFSGSSLGQRIFSQQERAAMRAHAQGVRNLDHSIEQLPAVQGAQQARAGYERVFGGQDVGGAQQATFRRIIEGVATPQETAQAVFGAISSGNPGNVGRMIESIRNIVGADSDTMSAIRQGVWQKLTKNAAGKDQPGAQRVSQDINEFLNGRGAGLAKQLYSPDELALMKRYADAIKKTVIPPRAATRSDTTVGLLSALNKYGSAVATAIGAGVEGVTGGLSGGLLGAAAGYGVSKLVGNAVGAVKEVQSASRARQHFDWQGAPPKTPMGRRAAGAAAVPFLADKASFLASRMSQQGRLPPPVGQDRRSDPYYASRPPNPYQPQ